jgi:hypothetical protein
VGYYVVRPDDVDPVTGTFDVFRTGSFDAVLEYVETLAAEYGYYGAVDIDGQIVLADCYSHVLDCEYGTGLTVPCPGHRIGTVQLLEAD